MAGSALGGWSLDLHHAYDPATGTIWWGDGSIQQGTGRLARINRVSGTPGYYSGGYAGDGGPAGKARLNRPEKITLGPDGTLYIADTRNHRIRRVSPDGVITTLTGTGDAGSAGDGGPAGQAQLNQPQSVALGPDGSLYIADTGNHRIRRVTQDGTITTVAGTGSSGYSGDGNPAGQARLNRPEGVDVAPDGTLYIADTGNHRIRQVTPDGVIATFAGTGVNGYSGDGGIAGQAQLNQPQSVALGPNGSLYIADTGNHRIRRVMPDGIITTLAGTGVRGESEDGTPAVDARLNRPEEIDVGPDGILYIADTGNYRIRRVIPQGIITTLAGTGAYGYSGDGGAADQAQLRNPAGIAYGPDGDLYIADTGNNIIRRVGRILPGVGAGEYLIPDRSGSRLFHFDTNGRHLRTLDSTTGVVIWRFRYDADGHLAGIEDADGKVIRIERGGDPAIAIVSPDGMRTTLEPGASGYLARVTDPSGQSWEMAYAPDGLMRTFTDRNGNRSEYTFDADGRLVRDEDPVAGGWSLERQALETGYSVTMTSGEGRARRFQVERLPGGSRHHTATASDGSVAITTYKGAVTTTTYADGTVSETISGPDGRFSMQSPVEQSTVTTPGGLRLSTTTGRAAALSDPDDLLSHSHLTETVTVNGRRTVSRYDAASRTWTRTTPEGRARTATLDDKGRLILEQTAGLAATQYSWDEHGRLKGITSGGTAGGRTLQLTYDSNGNPATLTDALGRVTEFTSDVLGRVNRQRTPDDRDIEFGFDPNGNLIGLTPPDRRPHAFAYTAGDQQQRYTPPAVGGVSAPASHYEYNRDKQLTRVSRPDGRTLEYGYDPETGRLTTLTIPRGDYGYHYATTTGHLAGIVTPEGNSLDYTYDGFLPTGTSWGGEIEGSVTRTYDNDFQVESRSVNDAYRVELGYDDDGLLIRSGDLTLERDSRNGLITGSHIEDLQSKRAYDGFGELQSEIAGLTPEVTLEISPKTTTETLTVSGDIVGATMIEVNVRGVFPCCRSVGMN
jgi:YD repeat-containing protein